MLVGTVKVDDLFRFGKRLFKMGMALPQHKGKNITNNNKNPLRFKQKPFLSSRSQIFSLVF